MKRLHIFCEGQTEEAFVNVMLYNHFLFKNIIVNPIVVRTSKKGKGGVSTYGKIKKQIEKKCQEDRSSFITTMLDFYGLPKDFPCEESDSKKRENTYQQALTTEKSFQNDIAHTNFVANLMIHEFEGILFSQPEVFDDFFEENTFEKMSSDISLFESPEHINDSPETAPSKRIISYYPTYQKISDGILIAQKIGLDRIRERCQHFGNWIEKLECLGGEVQ
jgi:hypothetical protein